MNGQPHVENTFRAIIKASESISVEISENEYKIIKEMRRLFDLGKHHQLVIGQRDGKFLIYHINLHTSF